MGTVHGKNGSIKVGAAALAEITEFSYETSAAVADDTSMGDDWETHLVGQVVKSWTANIVCNFNDGDTAQQALVEGASVTLNMFPAGAGALAKYKTGLATIEKVGTDVKKGSTVTRTFSAKGNGALSDAQL